MIMLILLILLVATPVYAGIGAVMGRKHYTELMRQYNNRPSTPIKEVVERRKVEQKLLRHEAYCNLNYQYLRTKGCDCSTKTRWWQLKTEIDLRSPEIVSRPDVPYHMLATWPVHVLGSYMTSGANRLPNPELIKQLEQQLKD